MPEFTNASLQTVAVGQNVLFTETPVGCNRGYVVHREGSGNVTLRGITNQCRARYKVSILGIKKNDVTKLMPMADHEFDAKEHLMVIGQIEDVKRLLKNFENETSKKNRK